MASSYSVTINIAPATVTELQDGLYSLYAFKAVQGPPGAVPLVWFSTTGYSASTEVSWTEDYYAYTSTFAQLNPDTHIVASASCAVDLGDLVTVGLGGVPSVSEGQDPLSVSILNGTTTNFVCGLSQPQGGGTTYVPMCAFPLLASMQDEIVPIEKIFLMFATREVNTGTVLEESIGWGALVDLTADNDMVVSYDLTVTGGWTKAPGVTPVEPNTHLVPLLITDSSALAQGDQLAAR